MAGAAQAMATSMAQSMAEQMAAATGQMGSALSKTIGEQLGGQFKNISKALQKGFKVDANAFANAMHFNMTQDDLTSLLMNYMNADELTYDGNLKKLGYASEDNPESISIYSKDFAAKEQVLDIIDGYNDRVSTGDDSFHFLLPTAETALINLYRGEILEEKDLPKRMFAYTPCYRSEAGTYRASERGMIRGHQFNKVEMFGYTKPEDSKAWFDKLWQNTVDLFRSLDIPVRTLECCSGDLADLKVKSVDVEAWSPRQQKYFEVGSCSNLGDAQARRLKIRVKGDDGKTYLAHTLNNTVVAPPRMLIAFLENNLNADGSVNIPVALRPYMGGKEVLTPVK
jgi:hypothetical protein